MQCLWLVCESGIRWRRAIDHFGPRMLPEPEDALSVRSFSRVEDCQLALSRHGPAIVLWELPPQDAASALAAIDRAARGVNKPLQIVALPGRAQLTAKTQTDVELALRELGVTCVLTQPTSLADRGDMFRRFWQQNQRKDNLSIVRQIWDRLPWSAAF